MVNSFMKKNTYKKPYLIGLLFIILFFGLFASTPPNAARAETEEDAGTRAMPFLKIPIDARGAAIGKTFSTNVNDVTAVFWNPAGLNRMKHHQISLMHNEFIEGIKYHTLSGGFNLPSDYGCLGVRTSYLHMGEIPKTIAVRGYPFYEQVGTFTHSEILFSLSYANYFRLTNYDLLWGISGKYIRSEIDETTALGMLGDLGLIFDLHNWPLRFSLLGKNFGKITAYDQDPQKPPTRGKFGIGAHFWDESINFSGEVVWPSDGEIYPQVGTELWLYHTFAFRGGYIFRGKGHDQKGPTFGLGVNIGPIKVNYAFIPFELLGNTHRMNLNILF